MRARYGEIWKKTTIGLSLTKGKGRGCGPVDRPMAEMTQIDPSHLRIRVGHGTQHGKGKYPGAKPEQCC